MKRILTAILLILTAGPAWAGDASVADRIGKAMGGDHRSEGDIARNEYRHPAETLTFLGLEDGMTVMEIWPGGGWYTEILAPAIRDHGKFIVATWDTSVEGQPSYRYELPKKMEATFAKYPDVYDQVATEHFSPPESASLGAAESVDVILTFRNTHGWVNGGLAQDIFTEFARVLKPGGVLGVVQHRAEDGSDPAVTAKQGYVSEAVVKEFAANAKNVRAIFISRK